MKNDLIKIYDKRENLPKHIIKTEINFTNKTVKIFTIKKMIEGIWDNEKQLIYSPIINAPDLYEVYEMDGSLRYCSAKLGVR